VFAPMNFLFSLCNGKQFIRKSKKHKTNIFG
jgi:hypothetical protein